MRTLEQIIAEIDRAVLAEKDRIAQIAETVWKNPEVGYKEFKTSALAQNILQEMGYSVQAPLAVTGFRADWDTGKPGPCIAILGELDALTLPAAPGADPQTGAFHACGHHTHIAALLGVAMGLAASDIKDELCGKIAIIGCPAEECIDLEWRRELIRSGKISALGGKACLVREGVFDDVDAALMIHVGRGFGASSHNGFVKKIIRFKGKSCHAATPDMGINALNAATLALNAVAMLRETFNYDELTRVHGIMTRGGDAINIIPDDVCLEYQIRALHVETIKDVSARFDRAMKGCAYALGVDVEIDTLPGYMPLKNDFEFLEFYIGHARRIWNRPDLINQTGVSPGSTDMGDLSMIMPVIHGAAPGAAGVAHGIDFHITDHAAVSTDIARCEVAAAIELLYNGAEKFQTILEHKKQCMSIPEYIALTDSLKG